MQIKKYRKMPAPPAAETKESTEARFAWAADAPWLEQHDPLYHITENFQQSFDRIGRSHADAAAGGFREESFITTPEEEYRQQTEQDRQAVPAAPGKGERKNADKEQRVRLQKREASPITRFSEIAFRRGAMSAAVLNGTGKMMLVSCLKRTAYESGPKHLQQQDLLETGSITRAVAGHAPDQMIFNRGFANSALGIVVDTLRDARRVVESMSMIAQRGEGRESEFSALYKLYPFLDDSRDEALESEYRAKLASCKDEREKPVLQNALVKTISLRAKKAQMKNEFINKLRFISDRAAETLSELETPGFAEELVRSAFGEESDELPENPDEGADGDAPNGKKNGADKAAGSGAAAEAAGSSD